MDGDDSAGDRSIGDSDARSAGGSSPRSTSPRSALSALVPAGVGALLAAILVPHVLPALALAAGAAVSLPLAWLLRADYAVATTLFVLAVGAYVAGVELGGAYDGWTGPIFLAVGGVSALFLLGKSAVKAVVRVIGRRYARGDLLAELWDVGASLVSLGYVLWNALQFGERVVRSLAIAVVAPSMVALNAYMTVADLASAALVDLTAGLFVVALVLGAHTLGTWDRATALVREWGRAGVRGSDDGGNQV